jgi:serpin B
MSHFLALAACLAAPPADATPPGWTPAMQRAGDANTRFACRMLGSWADKTSTLCLSPLGLFAALSMAAGADAPARRELTAALQLPPGDDEAVRDAGQLLRYYAAPRAGVTFAWEAAVWGDPDRGRRQPFRDRLTADFAPSFRPAAPGRGGADRNRINGWAAAAAGLTRPALLREDPARDGVRLVLACGLRFRGDWADPFPPARTANGRIVFGDGTEMNHPVMHRTGAVRCFRDADVEVMELPLAGGEFSVVLVRLVKSSGQRPVTVEPTPERLAAWLARLREERRDDVAVPIVSEEDNESFDDRLASTGVRGVYGVAQASRVRLSERGFECGAASAVVGAGAVTGANGYIGRETVFLLRDTRRGTILFAGRHLVPTN